MELRTKKIDLAVKFSVEDVEHAMRSFCNTLFNHNKSSKCKNLEKLLSTLTLVPFGGERSFKGLKCIFNSETDFGDGLLCKKQEILEVPSKKVLEILVAKATRECPEVSGKPYDRTVSKESWDWKNDASGNDQVLYLELSISF